MLSSFIFGVVPLGNSIWFARLGGIRGVFSLLAVRRFSQFEVASFDKMGIIKEIGLYRNGVSKGWDVIIDAAAMAATGGAETRRRFLNLQQFYLSLQLVLPQSSRQSGSVQPMHRLKNWKSRSAICRPAG